MATWFKPWRTPITAVFLTLATLALYWPSWHQGFILFDDPEYIRDNFHINNGFSLEGLVWCFKGMYASNWHPLTWISLMFDCQFHGVQPGWHHLTNIVLHAVNTALLLLVLLRWTKFFLASVLVAALFAWHPMHVESVAWISERKDVLSTLFLFLTLLIYESWKVSRRRYGWALFFYALALMAKPMVVTLPFLLLLLDFWPKQTPLPWKKLVAEKIPFFILSAASCVVTLIAQSRSGVVLSLERLPLSTRLMHVPVAYWQYLQKAIYPVRLSIYYPYETHLSVAAVAGSVMALGVITGLSVYFRRTRPWWLVGWCWFLGTLVPVIGLVQVGQQSMADRYSYVPFIGLFLIFVWEFCLTVKGSVRRRSIGGIVALAVLGMCAGLTAKQLTYWQNSGTLFAHGVEVVPDNPVAHANYALYLRDRREWAAAQTEIETALRLSPDYSWGHMYLGHILFLQNKLEAAAGELQIALKLNASLFEAHQLLGQIDLAQNTVDAAQAEFLAGLKTHPEVPSLHCYLGQTLALQNRLEEAAVELHEALRLVAQYPEAHYQLAMVSARQRNFSEAIEHYEAAIRLQPNFADAMNNLAWLYAANADVKIRNGTKAVALAEKACQLTKDQAPMMIGTLAAAYAEAGRFADAIVAAARARDTAAVQGDKALTGRNAELLKLYQSGRPYHEP